MVRFFQVLAVVGIVVAAGIVVAQQGDQDQALQGGPGMPPPGNWQDPPPDGNFVPGQGPWQGQGQGQSRRGRRGQDGQGGPMMGAGVPMDAPMGGPMMGGPGMGGQGGPMMGGMGGFAGMFRGDRGMFQPELLVNLSETNAKWNTPDGMCCLPDQTVLVAMPNFNDQTSAPSIISISPDGKAETWLELPENPETGRFGPMGIACTPDGSAVYLNDNQVFHQKDKSNGDFLFGKSRLMRIEVKDGKPGEMVTVAKGINVANAVVIKDDSVYVTETVVDPSTLEKGPVLSGFYRFALSDRDVVIENPMTDSHLVSTLYSFNPKIPWGADGAAFDKDGNFYVGTFADGTIYRFTFNDDGSVKERKLWLKPLNLKSCDGMFYEPNRNALVIADYIDNAVKMVMIESGLVLTLAKSPDGDGADGGLNSPCEVCLRGSDILVSNMNSPVEGGVDTKMEPPVTMSVIAIPEQMFAPRPEGTPGMMGMGPSGMGGPNGEFNPGQNGRNADQNGFRQGRANGVAPAAADGSNARKASGFRRRSNTNE